MSVFDWKVQWNRVNNPDETGIIDDCFSAKINKSIEIKNNITTLNLRNAPLSVADDGSVIGKYVEPSTKEIKFLEDDELEIWTDYLDDASEVGTSWYDADRYLGLSIIEEFQNVISENGTTLQIKAVDGAYKFFNSIYNFSYGIGNNFTAPGIIRNCARQFTEAGQNSITTFTGTHNDSGVNYTVDSRFVSEGGNITDYRDTISTQLNGGINDAVTTITVDSTADFESAGSLVIDTEHIAYTGKTDTTFTGCTRGIDDTSAASHSDNADVYQGFPLIIMSKIWKPLFEWIGECSQTDNTNYLDEVQEGGSLYYNRAFLFWMDKNNSPHWVYPDDTVDLTVDLGEEGRRAFRLKKSVFDAVNFVIFNCGTDMYGNGNLYYWYDYSTDTSGFKMRNQPMIQITKSLLDDDRKVNTVRDTTETDIYRQFPDAGEYPLVPTFLNEANLYRSTLGQTARTDVDNDTEYNDCLREAARWRGLQEAKKITSRRAGLRYSGQIVIKGAHVNPGDLVKVNNAYGGLNSQLLRVTNVTHNINRNNWETTLAVEEDEKVIE